MPVNCPCVARHARVRLVTINTRAEKRRVLDAEKRLIQALHFNQHVRSRHYCTLSYRNACHFGVDKVWCEFNDVEYPCEIEGEKRVTAALQCLRHMFARNWSSSTSESVQSDALQYLRILFAETTDTTSAINTSELFAKYLRRVTSLKRRVVCGQISGGRYHDTETLMLADAIREGLTPTEFERICIQVDCAIDYTRLPVSYACCD